MDHVGYERPAADAAGHSISTPLRVLLLEDNPRDVELYIQQLSKAGFELQVDAVDTPEGFAAKPQSRVYNLILANNSIPKWTSNPTTYS